MRVPLLREAEPGEIELCRVVGRRRLGGVGVLVVPLVEKRGYPLAEGFGLRPSAVGKGGIVGRGRREMPRLVSSIEACAVSGDAVSYVQARNVEPWMRLRRYLATITTAGPFAMTR